MNTWWFVWRLIRYAPGVFLAQSALQIFFLTVQVVPGLIEKAIFDTITGARRHTVSVATLIALYISVGLARPWRAYGETWAGRTFRYRVGCTAAAQFAGGASARPGAVTPPVAPGEAVNRYRDDVAEVADFPLWLPDVVGNLLAFVMAVTIMARINLTITLFVFLPLAVAFHRRARGVGTLSRLQPAPGRSADARSRLSRRDFGAVQAVKIADAIAAGRGPLPQLGDTAPPRRRAAGNAGGVLARSGAGGDLWRRHDAAAGRPGDERRRVHGGRLCAVRLLSLVHHRPARLSGPFSATSSSRMWRLNGSRR
jgi:ATP-binding cassette subfamily B protein